MPRPSRFIPAEKKIRSFFSTNNKRVFNKQDLSEILEKNKQTWNLSDRTYTDKFIEKLLSLQILQRVPINIPSKHILDLNAKQKETDSIERYFFDHPSIFEIAVSLKHKSYLSHYSAVYLNDLTNQLPKIVYVTYEQSFRPNRTGFLTQDSINKAFSMPQRKSENIYIVEDYTIMLLSGMNTGRQGVYTPLENKYPLPITNIERTLIDITVRPNYSGGTFAVLEAYKNSIDKISSNKLMAMLKNIKYIYPYHQAIGFYLERAGYKGNLLKLLKEIPMTFDFYLTYQILEKDYSKEWKIFYPKGM